MKKRTPRLVVTFHTTAEAMATERICKKENISGRLMPARHAVTADCGIAFAAPPEERERIAAALEAAGIEPAGMLVMEL